MRRALLPLTVLLVLAWPAGAQGDGLPVGNVDVGGDGVTVPASPDRVVTLPAGRRTVVARVQRDGGEIGRSLVLDERLTVPGVALDATADGMSGDGRTVALIRPRPYTGEPQRRTRIVLLGVRPLRVLRRLTLHGDFSFDALSADGRRMFLVQYVDPKDLRKYVVRSFDVGRGRLEPGAIVDAREPDEDMRGYPVTRVSSLDGRWAYTLYDGGGEPFVHALDTAERRAFCIDLPMLAGFEEPYRLRLALVEGRLSVLDGGRTEANVDTGTMRVRSPGIFGAFTVPLVEV
jgi:hypothetical protein